MILITGHAGFIGSHLVNKLEEDGIDWIGYDLEYQQCDIRDRYRLNDLFQKNNIDSVIHLAARAGVRKGEKFPEEYSSTNIIGTKNLIDLSEQYKVKHFVFFSSSSVYGSGNKACKESDHLNPMSFYGASKLTGEIICKNSDVPKVTIIRPFTVYGEDGRKDQVIFKWIEQIKTKRPVTFFGDGTTKRGYTYVGDLVEGVLKVMSDKSEGVEIYNLGGSEIVTLRELLGIFRNYVDMKKIEGTSVTELPLPKEDVPYSWADISKAKKKLAFNPNTNFNDKVIEILKKEL